MPFIPFLRTLPGTWGCYRRRATLLQAPRFSCQMKPDSVSAKFVGKMCCVEGRWYGNHVQKWFSSGYCFLQKQKLDRGRYKVVGKKTCSCTYDSPCSARSSARSKSASNMTSLRATYHHATGKMGRWDNLVKNTFKGFYWDTDAGHWLETKTPVKEHPMLN